MASEAAATMAPLTFLAECEHCTTQRIQEMHFLPSAFSEAVGTDGLGRAPLRTQAAFHAGFISLGNQPAASCFFVGPVSGDCGAALVTGAEFCEDFLGKCDTFAYKHYSTGSKALWALRPSSAKNAVFPS